MSFKGYYKKCFVPTCSNSWKTTPDKKFFFVRKSLKQQWCQKYNIKYNSNDCYCCEDHLNFEEDIENYLQWKMMKVRPILKSTASLKLNDPHTSSDICEETTEVDKLNDQEPSILQTLLTSRENLPPKKHRLSFSSVGIPLKLQIDAGTQCKVKTSEKSTNYNTRIILPSRDSAVAPKSVKLLSSPTNSENPSSFGWSSETSFSTDVVCSSSKKLREAFLQLVKDDPKMYLGIPKQFMWLVKVICEQSHKKLREIDIIVTLFKIRQNDSMIRISKQFQIPFSALPNIFFNGLECLANYFQNLIYLPPASKIKKHLPAVFKVRFSNVQCILDCFEIEIEKPSNPLKQAQTWSQYKNCNTIKYLLGCTPNGLVTFVSKGFGGRISDKAILEKSQLIDILPCNAVVMADRGFKEVESYLMNKGIKLLRPPSVYSGTKPTKEQVIKSKVIASLRVHVERVIRRLREFRFLKPHSVVKYKHVCHMDETVIIACGLINLQNEIIKSQ